MEQYFSRNFNVSRGTPSSPHFINPTLKIAQIYRLLDCAAVLRALEGMHPLPHKYKICKDLKQKAGIGAECRALWERVIREGGAGEAREVDIEAFCFEQLPNFIPVKKRLAVL